MFRLIISLVLGAQAIVFAAQYQVLDVCIQVTLDQSFRKSGIPVDELEKHGRFGMMESPPFDKYFRVSSALYHDFIDVDEFFEIKKNLIKHAPFMIENDIKKLSTHHESVLLQQYKFP